MNGLNDYEKAFVQAICEYTPPPATDLSKVSKNDPQREWKFDSFQKSQNATKNIISSLSSAVNHYAVNTKAIINEIKQDKKGYDNLVQLAYEWVDFWNKADNYHTDPRNLASTNLCKDLAEAMIKHDGYVIDTSEFAGLDVAIMQMHKTLVQTSTVLFSEVLRNENRSVKNYMKERYGERTVSLPMI